MTVRSNSLKGSTLVFVSAICFASYGVWARLLGHEFGIFYQGWVRSAIIVCLMLPFALTGKHFKPVRKSDRLWFAITLICTVFTQAPLYFAFNHLPLGTATFIFYGFFLITSYAVGWLFLSEKLTLVKIISLALAFIGLLLTFGLSLALFSVGAMLLAAFNGVASGAEIATSKKSTPRYSSFQITFCSWVLVFLTHLPISVILKEPQIVPAFSLEWAAMLGYAVSGLGGFWLIMEGFKHIDASIGGLIGLLEVPLSAVLGMILFHDQITVSVIFGGHIIVAAAVLPDVYALRHPKEKPLPPHPPV
jgi:drug/metabolite transporter (DMT)-like permease